MMLPVLLVTYCIWQSTGILFLPVEKKEFLVILFKYWLFENLSTVSKL
jgi:hypothetical protein